MPIYEYECSDCGNVLEVQQRITDDPLETCPECGGKVKKLISMSAFHLKGGGWYADGYAGPSNGSGKDKGKGDKGGQDAKPPCQKGEGAGCAQCPAASSA